MEHFSKEVDEITADFLQSFGRLTAHQLNWKPNTETWSIGQNIDHLMVINETYAPILQQLQTGDYRLPWHARFDFLVNFLGKTVLKAVEPARKKKMKTFPLWEPRQSSIPADILDQFQKHQEKLKLRIQSCAGLMTRGAVISSPANRIIVYKLDTAFEIMLTHERRHLNQARVILKSIEKNSF